MGGDATQAAQDKAQRLMVENDVTFTAVGDRASITFTAERNDTYFCTIPGHRAAGMVGRFEEGTRRRMLYYYHALVTGDVEGAAKFLVDMARVGPGGPARALMRRAFAHELRRRDGGPSG